MHIVFGHIGQLEVIDVFHIGNIQTTGRHIGGHQHLDRAGLERIERALALALGFVAMDRGHGKPFGGQLFRQLFHAMFGAPKHQRQLVAVFVQQFHQQIEFRSLGDVMHLLGDLVGGLARRVHLNALGVDQVRGGNFFHLLGHRGRKQHGLAVFGNDAGNLAQRVDKAQIQHLIGLVQHQKAGLIQPQRAPF